MRALQELVAAQASRRPESVAVVSGSEQLAYGELDERSSRLAAILSERGVTRGSRVCMLLPKGSAAMVSILGILKAGAAYVPLDPDNPAPRTRRMLTSCDDRFLLASSEGAGLVSELLADRPSHGEWCVGWLDDGEPPELETASSFSMKEVAATPPLPAELRANADDLAYIMFTSGSTGVPKGVPITHRNVLTFVEWAVRYFGMGPEDRSSSHPPLHFDLSVFDIFGSIAAGSQLHLVPKSLNLLAGSMARFIRDRELTQWFSVPSVLNYMMKADCVLANDFPSMKRLLWCGEVLPTPTLIYFMERLPHVSFTNLYGPTEATIASSYYTVPAVPKDEHEDVPIGTACPGEELLVLGEDRAALPRGEIGDLHIAGAGLSPGYWRDAEKTAAAFVEIARDGGSKRVYRTGDLAWMDERGLVHYVGRADSQIKSRGYRIELGEIESSLLALAQLDEVAVIAVETDGFEGWTICCAYAPREGGAPDPSHLSAALRERLPGYMIPQRWRAYARLPTNANGKIDRPRLKVDFAGSA